MKNNKKFIAEKIFETGPHNFLFYLGAFVFVFFLFGTINELFTSWDGKIVQREEMCQQPLNNRCKYLFTFIDDKGGKKQTTILAYAFDDDEIVIGNVIYKERFSFNYKINGKSRMWPYFFTYLSLLPIGIFVFILWLSPRIRKIINNALR